MIPNKSNILREKEEQAIGKMPLSNDTDGSSITTVAHTYERTTMLSHTGSQLEKTSDVRSMNQVLAYCGICRREKCFMSIC